MTIFQLIANPVYKNKHVLHMLLMHFLQCSKEDIILRYDETLTESVVGSILEWYKKYTDQHWPLEFVLGYVQFFGRQFSVDQRVLIPRPETEYMIESVCDAVKNIWVWPHPQPLSSEERGDSSPILIDVGTGCGVLGISSFLENPEFFTRVYLTELSEDALEVAKKNVQTLVPDEQRGQIDFVVWDLVESMTSPPTPLLRGEGSNIRIVANLPYIPDQTFDTQTEDRVRDHEPRMAFVGGNDGLDLYRRMFLQIRKLVGTENIPSVHKNSSSVPKILMFLEMMTWQVDVLRQEFGDWLEFEEVKTFHFQIRIVKAWLK